MKYGDILISFTKHKLGLVTGDSQDELPLVAISSGMLPGQSPLLFFYDIKISPCKSRLFRFSVQQPSVGTSKEEPSKYTFIGINGIDLAKHLLIRIYTFPGLAVV